MNTPIEFTPEQLAQYQVQVSDLFKRMLKVASDSQIGVALDASIKLIEHVSTIAPVNSQRQIMTQVAVQLHNIANDMLKQYGVPQPAQPGPMQ